MCLIDRADTPLLLDILYLILWRIIWRICFQFPKCAQNLKHSVRWAIKLTSWCSVTIYTNHKSWQKCLRKEEKLTSSANIKFPQFLHWYCPHVLIEESIIKTLFAILKGHYIKRELVGTFSEYCVLFTVSVSTLRNPAWQIFIFQSFINTNLFLKCRICSSAVQPGSAGSGASLLLFL